MDLTLSGVSGATIDLQRAGLDGGSPVRIALDGDGVTTLQLLAQWPSSVEVRLDDRVIDMIQGVSGVVVVNADVTGPHVLSIRAS